MVLWVGTCPARPAHHYTTELEVGKAWEQNYRELPGYEARYIDGKWSTGVQLCVLFVCFVLLCLVLFLHMSGYFFFTVFADSLFCFESFYQMWHLCWDPQGDRVFQSHYFPAKHPRSDVHNVDAVNEGYRTNSLSVIKVSLKLFDVKGSCPYSRPFTKSIWQELYYTLLC